MNIYNIHKYSISNNVKKREKKRKLRSKHGTKDQLWQQKYQCIYLTYTPYSGGFYSLKSVEWSTLLAM